MRKLIAAALLFFSSLVIAQSSPPPTPGNGEWEELHINAKYKVLDTRDDILMFRFTLAFRDFGRSIIVYSTWYVDCGESKAALFSHQFEDLESGVVFEDKEYPPQWVTFAKEGLGWRVQETECGKMMSRVKNEPAVWKHFAS